MLSQETLLIDADEITEKAVKFIQSNIHAANLKRAVVSASGGIDSSVTLALSVKALGNENVRAVTMPERNVTPESEVADAMQLARQLDVTCSLIEITPAIDAMESILPVDEKTDQICKGNLRPRIRMAIAYYYANTLQGMVIGSSNKTELMTGYFTKYGDGASDIMPLGDLYKTQVRQLARHLNIPSRIIEKVPSARLWPGQTSEGELGVKFEVLDLVLSGLEKGLDKKDLAERLQVPISMVSMIEERVKSNKHKRRIPQILRLSSKG